MKRQAAIYVIECRPRDSAEWRADMGRHYYSRRDALLMRDEKRADWWHKADFRVVKYVRQDAGRGTR